jgi:hypothetical protein
VVIRIAIDFLYWVGYNLSMLIVTLIILICLFLLATDNKYNSKHRFSDNQLVREIDKLDPISEEYLNKINQSPS